MMELKGNRLGNMQKPNVFFHEIDFPDGLFDKANYVAIDTEAMGLNIKRDRLCLVQLSAGDGACHLVQIKKNTDIKASKNLLSLLISDKVGKIFHYGRFDIALLQYHFKILINGPIFCTKIASRLARTYTDKHSLKELAMEFLKIEISKAQQTTDWGQENLSQAQKEYAAIDVLYLHQLKDKLTDMLQREGRLDIAEKCFSFLPIRCQLDLLNGENADIFSY